MYGWNFHQGRVGGMNWADIIYQRIGQKVQKIRAEQAVLAPQPTEPGR